MLQQQKRGILHNFENSNWFWLRHSHFSEKSDKRKKEKEPTPPQSSINYQIDLKKEVYY